MCIGAKSKDCRGLAVTWLIVDVVVVFAQG